MSFLKNLFKVGGCPSNFYIIIIIINYYSHKFNWSTYKERKKQYIFFCKSYNMKNTFEKNKSLYLVGLF